MRAKIRFFEWDGLRPDRRSDEPVNLTMIIGPLDGPGDEVFQVTICTLEAISSLVARDGMLLGRYLLIVDGMNTARVEAFFEDRLRRLDGDTWPQLAEKIARIARWEFEDNTLAPGTALPVRRVAGD